jgi:hypothetical protein
VGARSPCEAKSLSRQALVPYAPTVTSDGM